MAFSGFTWVPNCSLTAMKYHRHGVVETRPFQPGQRYDLNSLKAGSILGQTYLIKFTNSTK